MIFQINSGDCLLPNVRESSPNDIGVEVDIYLDLDSDGEVSDTRSITIHITYHAQSWQIARDPYLSSLGFIVNTLICALICERCKWAILPQQAQGHLNHTHPEDKLKIVDAPFQAALNAFDVGDIYPSPPESGLDGSRRLLFPEIQGLKLHVGVRCEHCSKVLGSKLAMTTHHQQAHKGIPIPKAWPSCYLQQFHPNKAQTMFEVSCRENPAPTPTIVDDIIRDMHKIISSAKTTVGRGTRGKATVIDPWLLTCKWHIHVAPYDVNELRARVEMPKDDEFPGLKDLVQLYFERATELINHTDDLTLQYINTPNPDKG